MPRYTTGTNISDFDAVRLCVASSTDILDWSYGEVIKPETINYRTQKPERDGLFCERIFGPVKDVNQHDVKYKGLRTREAAVDKNGEVVTKSIVRRERMGHITLAAPVAHIWFLRGTPSASGLVLGMTVKSLERIVYFASYVVISVDYDKLATIVADTEAEYAAKSAEVKSRYEQEAQAEGANVKALAELQTKELEEIALDFEEFKTQANSLVKLGLLNEVEYRGLPDDLRRIIKVGMGGSAIYELLKEVNIKDLIETLSAEEADAKGMKKKKLQKRLRMLESMEKAGIKPESLCLTVLPVIPPDLRPMVQLTGGRFATSDLNDLYRRVINRNNRLKKLVDLNAPEVIKRNEQRMLQEAVDALIDNGNTRSGRAVAATGQRRRLKSLSDMLRGKQGRFRQNLLGKRVDYSGRSVIVTGPELKIDECGLPKMMALELFKPFVIGELIAQEYAHNIRTATRLIEAGEIAVWDALDRVIKDKFVLLNRAPSLHRLSIQAFKPKLIEGKAIQLHPLVCKGFNADFDGDQMAVHLPLSDESQREAREIMSAANNILKPADGSPILHIEQDIVLGVYYLTYERVAKKASHGYGSLNEALHALQDEKLTLQSWIKVPFRGQLRDTTLGRVLFNEIFPEDFAFQDDAMTKKRLSKVLAQVYEQYGQAETARIADDLKDLGFLYATKSGLSMGMDDFSDIKGLDAIIKGGEAQTVAINDQYEQGFITEPERYRLTVDNWQKIDATVQDTLAKQFANENTSMSIAVVSGARGNIGQVKTSVGMLGVVSDATGRAIELPVKSNYKNGFTPLEYFTATRGARKGMIDTALKTADSGYLTRRLVDVAQDVFTVDDDINDPGLSMYRSDAEEIGVTLGSRLVSRYAAEQIRVANKAVVEKGELITTAISELIENSDLAEVKIMSVLTGSNFTGVSRKSYGLDPATGKLVTNRNPIGVIAAQSIGEPGTQLTLKTFHSGGVAGEDITTGLPRVEELFEARTPKGQAFVTDISGDVEVWEDGENYIVQVTGASSEEIVLMLDGRQPALKNGADVAIGDVVAANDGGKDPLICPMAGSVIITEREIVIKPLKASVVRYEIPGYKQLAVKTGHVVVAGSRLTNGSINLHDLMRLQGVAQTQRYIMTEISKIFAAQGQFIADKHMEVIVRQMFSRVMIEDAGDSTHVTGDMVSKIAVLRDNLVLIAEGKSPIDFTQLLLGITKVSTYSDSFLSAASFQDTTRVLISAATSGKLDHLVGLKENVILGRRIPVGTGAPRVDEQ
jgi:DNA-directed RNA polymerase subunit beta'